MFEWRRRYYDGCLTDELRSADRQMKGILAMTRGTLGARGRIGCRRVFGLFGLHAKQHLCDKRDEMK